IFPNTYMLAQKVANHTTHPVTRVAISVGVAYRASIEAARVVLLETIGSDERVKSEPAPAVVVAALAESSVDLTLSFWVDDEKIAKPMMADYRERIKNALDAAGIEIPFPHVQLMLE